MGLALMEGNEAIARGAIAAGCNFFAGYPITPATTIYHHMLNLLPPRGGLCLQGEDEIASIGFCLGASMAGMKTMTASSGPGISLYSEQISFAVGSEIPIVIVDVQRLGPSTGSATRGADGDVQFLRWGNSGGMPVIVLAPVDAMDCYRLTLQAFNLAEQFRCPVFVATNKEIGLTRETVDMGALDLPFPQERRMAAPDSAYLPFETKDGRKVPDFMPIGAKTLVRQTSSTHGPDGYITTDPDLIGRMLGRLHAKLMDAVDALTFYDRMEVPGADTLVVAYGITARAAKAAAKKLAAGNRPASLLVLKTLWPVPRALIQRAAEPYSRILVVEMNLGQYVREIQRVLPNKEVAFWGQMNGELVSPEQIAAVIQHG